MALRFTQPLTEMNTRNVSGSKARPARKADNLTAIYEPRRLFFILIFSFIFLRRYRPAHSNIDMLLLHYVDRYIRVWSSWTLGHHRGTPLDSISTLHDFTTDFSKAHFNIIIPAFWILPHILTQSVTPATFIFVVFSSSRRTMSTQYLILTHDYFPPSSSYSLQYFLSSIYLCDIIWDTGSLNKQQYTEHYILGILRSAIEIVWYLEVYHLPSKRLLLDPVWNEVQLSAHMHESSSLLGFILILSFLQFER
jgi:hypothetical protein